MTEQELPLDAIDAPTHAHRLDITPQSVEDLAQLIDAAGLINAIRVKRKGNRFEVTAGHKRLLACRLRNFTTIRAIIDDDDSDARTATVKFAENFGRSDLSPIEEAAALDRTMKDLNIDAARIASLTRRSRPWVEQRLALLQLPDDLGPLVHSKAIAIASALELAKVSDASHRDYLTTYTINAGASLHVVRSWVSAWELSKTKYPDAEPPRPDMNIDLQRPIVQLPCFFCEEATDYTTMPIVRMCATCHANAKRALT